jgi:hypothetical protein|tara:strand:+ start:450 stop:1463 length:1014 start_codon:yes stop_codon:yes gene_type:complete
MESIFVQITSYRDPELVPTIKNLINRAAHPERLKICIAHQRHPNDTWDSLDEFKQDGRFIVIDIPYNESQGRCGAVYQTQQHYDSEDYVLSIEAHNRLTQDWDIKCVSMYKELQADGVNKPMITTYLPPYSPKHYPLDSDPIPSNLINTPIYGMRLSIWKDEMAMFHPQQIKDLANPLRSRFYSSQFAFTTGEFINEVPHDPALYYDGEEISMSVRAFTNGYELFTPNTVLGWFQYNSLQRKNHWDDHVGWTHNDTYAKNRVRQLLGIGGAVCTPCNKSSFKIFGLGEVKTLKDYEVFAGINFIDKTSTSHCIQNLSPPGNPKEELKEWGNKVVTNF